MNVPEDNQLESRLDRAIKSVRRDAAPPIDPLVDVELIKQARLETICDDQQDTKWRFPIRQFTRAAIAAAATVLVVFGGWSLIHRDFDSRAAIGKAIEQVRAANAIEFVTTTGVPGQEATIKVRSIVADSVRMRQEIDGPAPLVQIIDFQEGKMLSLIEQTKEAQLIDVMQLSEGAAPEDPVKAFTQLDPEHATYLRDELRNGVQTHVYRMHNGPIDGQVWIDAQTRMPVVMELTMPAIDGGAGQQVILDQFKWDVHVDESTFSMQIPDGYRVSQIDMSHPTEADWIMMLRVWAALTQAPYPDDLPRALSSIGQLAYDPSLSPEDNHRRLVDRLGPLFGEDAFNPEKMEASLLRLSETLGRGATFVMTLEQTEWRWVGGGVSAGEADKPLCWWKDADTGKYRMIYGDFTVREVKQGDLPHAP